MAGPLTNLRGMIGFAENQIGVKLAMETATATVVVPLNNTYEGMGSKGRE